MTADPYIILFDGRCRICQRSRQMIQRCRPAAAVRFVDVNDARELARYPQMIGADVRGQMHVIDPAGRRNGGYDALMTLVPILPPVAWLGRVLRLPPVVALGRRVYHWLAANRYRLGGEISCQGGACQLNL